MSFLVSAWIAVPGAHADTIIHDKDRIVFCGDSITGQGGNGGANGWVGLIGERLAIAHPEGHQTLAALGGSGATVGAWQNFEKRSRDNPVFLDVKGVDVKATLDGGADIVVIMLGMNDVLAPAVKDTPADLDAWAVRYHDLIESIKARTHPRVVALATITPCTEDADSTKNRVEAELNTRLAALAKQENALLLPTHEAMMELLATGRSQRADFHITADFVHPSPAGHLAIAVGMLRGLGESDAAAKLLEKHGSLLKVA
ncbi:MAG: GDSL-type esterase/lipase family protein, partial [Chthoniobacteraceae bacterium]